MFEEKHGIVVPNRSDHQPLGIVGRGRNDYLQAGDVGEDRVETLGVLRRCVHPCADQGTDDHWDLRLAAEHVTQFRPLIVNLIHGNTKEINEHQRSDGAQSRCCCANSCPDEACLTDRRVAHSVASKLAY